MRIQYVSNKHITYTRRKRMNITQTKLWSKLSYVYKYNVTKVTVCPQLRTYPYITHRVSWAGVSTILDKNPVHKHITPVKAGVSTTLTKLDYGYNSVGVLRGQRHIPNEDCPKYPSPTPGHGNWKNVCELQCTCPLILQHSAWVWKGAENSASFWNKNKVLSDIQNIPG